MLYEVWRLIPLGDVAFSMMVVWLSGFLHAVHYPAVGAGKREAAGCPHIVRQVAAQMADDAGRVGGSVRIRGCVCSHHLCAASTTMGFVYACCRAAASCLQYELT